MNNQRRVRSARPVYGRPPVSRNRRPTRKRSLHIGLIQQRVIILLLLILGVGFGLKQVFNVKKVSVESTTRKDELTREVQDIIAANWIQSNLLTLSPDRLSTQLQAAETRPRRRLRRSRLTGPLNVVRMRPAFLSGVV